jgi:hypothetical protein
MVLSNFFAVVQYLMHNEFLQYLFGEKAVGGACFMHIPVNVAYVSVREYKITGFVVLCESVCAVFH